MVFEAFDLVRVRNLYKQIIYIAQPPNYRAIMDDNIRSNKRDQTTKGYTLMRSTLDIAMGVLYMGIGGVLFFPEKVGLDMEGFDETVRRIFGGLCIVYGIWRIYRGIRKNY